MPRKPKPDVGQGPCPTCSQDVPWRKDNRGRFYPVCSHCHKNPNEFFLQHGTVYGPNGKPADAPAGTGTAPRAGEIVIPPRPVPKKVRALERAAAAPEPAESEKSSGSTGFLAEPAPGQEPAPPGDTPEPAPAPAGGFNAWLEHIGL